MTNDQGNVTFRAHSCAVLVHFSSQIFSNNG